MALFGMNTVVESQSADGAIRRFGGTASMDRTFDGVPIRDIPMPIDYDAEEKPVYKDEHVPVLAKLTAAIEAERVLRAPHAALAPTDQELWEDYAARIWKATGDGPPSVFALQPRWPRDMPARWSSLQLGMSDGAILMGWMADFDEKRQRDEDAHFAMLAEVDREVLQGPSAAGAIRTFRRAMRRLEAHATRTGAGRGTIATLRQTRLTLGLSPYYRSKRLAGFDESARWLGSVAIGHRNTARKGPNPNAIRKYRDLGWAREVAWFYARAAANVEKLASAARAATKGTPS